jgi:peroxiredoxin Q/BCP
MSQAQIDQKVSIDSIDATSNTQFSSEEFKGKKVILYFYPKDSTPGCTSESIDFTNNYDAIQKKNAVVFGISRDSLKSHENFKAKHEMPFELISDPDEILCNYFDVIKEKNMYGRKYMGIERSTFLIDENGILKKEWRKVKVKNHVNEVLQALDE